MQDRAAPARAVGFISGGGIVKLMPKTIHLCRNKQTTATFVLSRTLVFSPSRGASFSSEGRSLAGIFINLTMPLCDLPLPLDPLPHGVRSLRRGHRPVPCHGHDLLALPDSGAAGADEPGTGCWPSLPQNRTIPVRHFSSAERTAPQHA